VTVTIAHPMLFEVYAPVDKDKKETYSSNAVTHSYKNMISDILMSKNRTVYSVCLSCSGGWSVEANTTSMDQMMGIQWENRKYEKVFSEPVNLKQSYFGSCR
jgi:hypothetical protein